ncbi:MAG: protein arginine kinase [Candidatus Omnitrophica bacterium]|nr:protein arginine kinase [Candidatus Omnitrophota bacterium]
MTDFKSWVHRPAEWIKAEGPSSDVVVSSRLRLARNLEGFRFNQKLKASDRREIIGLIETAVKKTQLLKKSSFLRSSELSELEREFLLERHMISREHAEEKNENAVAISSAEDVSVMILEEDHLRLQVFQSGLKLTEAWQKINALDDELEKNLTYAFSLSLGYLTACPTNVGTGLRASCMVHLPGLVLTKQVHKVLQALAKLNLAARGLYGEGTQAAGNLFQFSNQMTLGQREEEIIDNLERVIRQVVEHEKEARRLFAQKRQTKVEDQIWRAVGTLKSARVMASGEATQLLSLVELGVGTGLVKSSLTLEDLHGLFLMIQPAHLQMASGAGLSPQERDEARANLIRDKLSGIQL